MSQCGCEVSSTGLSDLCIALGRVMYRRSEGFLSPYGVTPPQFDILNVLAQEGDVPLNRLSERLCCACSNVTGIVDRLERDGLVRRERSLEDRRVILLQLTESGRDLWRKIPQGQCCKIDRGILSFGGGPAAGDTNEVDSGNGLSPRPERMESNGV